MSKQSSGSSGTRLFRCRKCDFETFDKIQHWLHVRVHLPPEKTLTCRLCPFATEYKHHLEYHERTHNGYKPFKCDRCDYSAVTKSMLNSHKKSHSSFRCADCKFASKYDTVLNVHLKRSGHMPTWAARESINENGQENDDNNQKQQVVVRRARSRQKSSSSDINATNNETVQIPSIKQECHHHEHEHGHGVEHEREHEQEQEQEQEQTQMRTTTTTPTTLPISFSTIIRQIDEDLEQAHQQFILDLRVDSKLTNIGRY